MDEQKYDNNKWNKKKLQEGWKSVTMLVPPELAIEVRNLRRQFKQVNRHLYTRRNIL